MKLLLAKDYVERTLFAIEYKGKMTWLYRSSGLSGTGHGGDMIPFGCLAYDLQGMDKVHTTTGYIYKEFFYDRGWRGHRKSFYWDPKLQGFLDSMKEYVKDIHPEKHPEIKDWDVVNVLARDIMKEFKELEKTYEHLDLKLDI